MPTRSSPAMANWSPWVIATSASTTTETSGAGISGAYSTRAEIRMTAQIGENLSYEGPCRNDVELTIALVFRTGRHRKGFEANCTALWRGYVGTWEIRDGRLYLAGLDGTLQDGSRATVATFFPDYPDRVFAHWYSGTLRVPQGKLLDYVHGGYGSTYEDDLLITIEKGMVSGTDVCHNGKSDDPDSVEGYGIGAMTIFPHEPRGKGMARDLAYRLPRARRRGPWRRTGQPSPGQPAAIGFRSEMLEAVDPARATWRYKLLRRLVGRPLPAP